MANNIVDRTFCEAKKQEQRANFVPVFLDFRYLNQTKIKNLAINKAAKRYTATPTFLP